MVRLRQSRHPGSAGPDPGTHSNTYTRAGTGLHANAGAHAHPYTGPRAGPADLRPTGLTVELVENKVTLSWTAPAEDADSVTGYEILRRRPMEGETTLETLAADTESTATT